jgi:hypothetical protein
VASCNDPGSNPAGAQECNETIGLLLSVVSQCAWFANPVCMTPRGEPSGRKLALRDGALLFGPLFSSIIYCGCPPGLVTLVARSSDTVSSEIGAYVFGS